MYAGWRASDGHISAYVDRYGAHPLFYHFSDATLRLSDSITAIVSDLPQVDLDHTSLPVFFHLGFFLGEDTPFEGIRAMPPGGRLTWDGTHFEVSSDRPKISPASLSSEQATDGFIELFRTSMSRRLNQFGAPEAMLLSGGRDSRHICLELCRQNAKPRICGTSGDHQNDSDVVVARELAEQLGIQHRTISMGHDANVWHRLNMQATHYCADEHDWLAPAFAWLATETSVSPDGIAGDVLSGGRLSTKQLHSTLESGDASGVAAFLSNRHCPVVQGPAIACRELNIDYSLDHVTQRVRQELEAHLGTGSPISNFYFWNRTRREIALAPFVLGRQVGTMTAPFLDFELFDFLQSIPVEIRLGHDLHTRAIGKAYPEYSHVPFHNELSTTFVRRWRRRLNHYVYLPMLRTVRSFNALVGPGWQERGMKSYVNALRGLAVGHEKTV